MSEPAAKISAGKLLAVILLAVGCIFAYFAYEQSVDAYWTFDDKLIRASLAEVTGFSSAVDYVLHADHISPTGRPISLASFLFNAGDLPDHTAGFRRINVFIHILNTLLLALVAYYLAQLIPALTPNAAGFAVTLALMWLLHPFLASTSFHIIQRMTLLAGTFSLVAMITYLHGRTLLSKKPLKGYLWMSIGVVIATSIGILAKENAALTPLLIAVVEITLLKRYAPITQKQFRWWQLVFFLLPFIMLSIYALWYLVVRAEDTYLLRPYTLSERLLSESVILFHYLKQILLPNIFTLGPYQDDMDKILGLNWLSILATTGWMLSIALAIKIRKTAPIFSFTVLFFLAGHLIESTIFSLELYYEHRNYLPSLGILGAIAGLAWSTRRAWPKIVSSAYIVFLASLLWQINALWAQPIQAAISTANAHPTSSRSVQLLAMNLQQAGRNDLAGQVMFEGYLRIPTNSRLAAYVLFLRCQDQAYGEATQQGMIDSTPTIIDSAPRLDHDLFTVKTVHNIVNQIVSNNCTTLPSEDLIGFTEGLLVNPNFSTPPLRYSLNWALARIYDLTGDIAQATRAKIEAVKSKPLSADINGIYRELIAKGHFLEANHFLSQLRASLPQYVEQLNQLEQEQEQSLNQHNR